MTLRLLIAEDEDMIRNGIEKYIRLHTDRFAQIYTAQNGQEALDIIFQSRPDIMLLDVQMPLKDGIEVMKEAKGGGYSAGDDYTQRIRGIPVCAAGAELRRKKLYAEAQPFLGYPRADPEDCR